MVRGFYNKAFHSFVMSTIPLLHLPDPLDLPNPRYLPNEGGQNVEFRIIKEKEEEDGIAFLTEFTLTYWDFPCVCYLVFKIPHPSYRKGYVRKDGYVCIQATVLGALAYHGMPHDYFAPFYKEVVFPVLPSPSTFPNPSTFFSSSSPGVPTDPFPPSPFPQFSFLKNEGGEEELD